MTEFNNIVPCIQTLNKLPTDSTTDSTTLHAELTRLPLPSTSRSASGGLVMSDTDPTRTEVPDQQKPQLGERPIRASRRLREQAEGTSPTLISPAGGQPDTPSRPPTPPPAPVLETEQVAPDRDKDDDCGITSSAVISSDPVPSSPSVNVRPPEVTVTDSESVNDPQVSPMHLLQPPADSLTTADQAPEATTVTEAPTFASPSLALPDDVISLIETAKMQVKVELKQHMKMKFDKILEITETLQKENSILSKEIHSLKSQLVLLNYPTLGRTSPQEICGGLASNDALSRACSKAKVALVDHTPTFVTNNGAPRKALYRDDLHPSRQGTGRLACNIKYAGQPRDVTHSGHRKPLLEDPVISPDKSPAQHPPHYEMSEQQRPWGQPPRHRLHNVPSVRFSEIGRQPWQAVGDRDSHVSMSPAIREPRRSDSTSSHPGPSGLPLSPPPYWWHASQRLHHQPWPQPHPLPPPYWWHASQRLHHQPGPQAHPLPPQGSPVSPHWVYNGATPFFRQHSPHPGSVHVMTAATLV
ncbi:uncharacterized protein [Littorina saxatilis]|uniref:uncharacterized protein n=1 Tax=Littorina saxatilis TaxID=31220 RepID=UPI0038B62640